MPNPFGHVIKISLGGVPAQALTLIPACPRRVRKPVPADLVVLYKLQQIQNKVVPSKRTVDEEHGHQTIEAPQPKRRRAASNRKRK